MKRRPTSTNAQLDRVYAKVPAIRCTGACQDSCTEFPLPRAEKRRLTAATGVDFPPVFIKRPVLPTCPLLTESGQCSVYAIRPLVCRLWGVSDLFPCNYGCRPDGGRLLSIVETYTLIADAYEISGQLGMAARMRTMLTMPADKLKALTPVMQAMSRGLPEDEAHRAAAVILDRLKEAQ